MSGWNGRGVPTAPHFSDCKPRFLGGGRPTSTAKESSWCSQHYPSRVGFERFLAKYAKKFIKPGAVCLEWDQPVFGPTYCASTEAYRFAPGIRGLVRKSKGEAFPVVRGDLALEPSSLFGGGGIGSSKRRHAPTAGAYDVILCYYVFEHVTEPFRIAETLFHMLRPGGVIFFAAPFMERFHWSHGDNYRYTPNGAAHVFNAVGFETVQMTRIGDTRITTGALAGLGVGDFDPAYLDENLLKEHGAVSSEKVLMTHPEDWMFLASALVVRRPLRERRSSASSPRRWGCATQCPQQNGSRI